MEDPKLDFVGSNPGAVRHGNFINYYEFHPAQERVKNLPSDIWKSDRLCADKPFVSLDIGCNTGVRFTIKLKKPQLNYMYFAGADIGNFKIPTNPLDYQGGERY